MRSENPKWNRVEKILLNQIYVPQKPIIPKYPNQTSNPIPNLPERVIQNNKQIDFGFRYRNK